MKENYCSLQNVCKGDDSVCEHPRFLEGFSKFKSGKVHKGYILLRYSQINVLECVKNCLLTSLCEAINYRIEWKMCELVTNATDVNVYEDSSCLYSEISNWPKVGIFWMLSKQNPSS